MKNLVGKNVLITTQGWFIAPDGRQYRAAWGTMKAVAESTEAMGFQVSRAHTNWFISVGDMIIAGCQVLYCIKCETPPNFEDCKTFDSDAANGIKWYERPTLIYDASKTK